MVDSWNTFGLVNSRCLFRVWQIKTSPRSSNPLLSITTDYQSPEIDYDCDLYGDHSFDQSACAPFIYLHWHCPIFTRYQAGKQHCAATTCELSSWAHKNADASNRVPHVPTFTVASAQQRTTSRVASVTSTSQGTWTSTSSGTSCLWSNNSTVYVTPPQKAQCREPLRQVTLVPRHNCYHEKTWLS